MLGLGHPKRVDVFLGDVVSERFSIVEGAGQSEKIVLVVTNLFFDLGRKRVVGGRHESRRSSVCRQCASSPCATSHLLHHRASHRRPRLPYAFELTAVDLDVKELTRGSLERRERVVGGGEHAENAEELL